MPTSEQEDPGPGVTQYRYVLERSDPLVKDVERFVQIHREANDGFVGYFNVRYPIGPSAKYTVQLMTGSDAEADFLDQFSTSLTFVTEFPPQ